MTSIKDVHCPFKADAFVTSFKDVKKLSKVDVSGTLEEVGIHQNNKSVQDQVNIFININNKTTF